MPHIDHKRQAARARRGRVRATAGAVTGSSTPGSRASWQPGSRGTHATTSTPSSSSSSGAAAIPRDARILAPLDEAPLAA